MSILETSGLVQVKVSAVRHNFCLYKHGSRLQHIAEIVLSLNLVLEHQFKVLKSK